MRANGAGRRGAVHVLNANTRGRPTETGFCENSRLPSAFRLDQRPQLLSYQATAKKLLFMPVRVGRPAPRDPATQAESARPPCGNQPRRYGNYNMIRDPTFCI